MDAVLLFEELPTANGGRIAVATLNAEKTLNALSLEMSDLLAAQLTRWASDPAIAMVFLQGQGEKAFCAGGDLQALYHAMRAQRADGSQRDIRDNQYAAQFFAREYRLDYHIHTYPKPIVCWGHGIVMGGGIGLMAGASHRVVTERSRLAMPEIAIGLYPDVGASWFLSRMPGHLGLFLALTGAALNAADARFVGLADYQIPHVDKALLLASLCQQSWHGGQLDRALLTAVLQQAEHRVAAGTFAASPLREHAAHIDALCGLATLPEIVAALLAVDTEQTWLRKAVAGLAKGAPGSAWLAYALQRKVRHEALSLAEVFRLEYIATLHCVAGHDFPEGIRALIIDKDQQPRWNPAQLSDGSQAWAEQFFTSPWTAQQHPLADLGPTPA